MSTAPMTPRKSIPRTTSTRRISRRSSIRPKASPQASPAKKRSSIIRPASGRQSNGGGSNEETNIKVFVRCRARNEREISENSGVMLTTDGLNGTQVHVQTNQYSNKSYSFDRVFGPESDQCMVYDEVADAALKEVLSGFNCTIFAYGQTGTGKTYTMTGDLGGDSDATDQEKPGDNSGIIPRVLYNLFRSLAKMDCEHSVKTSYIELYNEELADLIGVEEDKKVKIYDDSNNKGSVVFQGMEEAFLQNYQQGLQVLRDGALKRQTAATKCNDLSSRSHSVFTITLHMKEITKGGEELVKTGKLNLVDLAGSENINRSGAEKKNAREAGMINQSLLTLGRVINALVEHSPHVPYRESKLTRILQDSLGGKTKTCIVATVTPAKGALDETLSTLEYASRAKSIKNKPQANQTKSKQAHMGEFVAEIERLRADLNATRSKSGLYLSQESYDNMVAESESRKIQVEEQKLKLEGVEQQLRTLREEREQFDARIKHMNEQVELKDEQLKDTQNQLNTKVDELAATQQRLNKTSQELDEKVEECEGLVAKNDHLEQVRDQLMDKLDRAQQDICDLKGQLDVSRKVNATNVESLTQLKSRVSGDVDVLGNELTAFDTQLSDIKSKLSSDLHSFLSNQGESFGRFFQQADSTAVLLENQRASMVELLNNGQIQIAGNLKELVEQNTAIRQSVVSSSTLVNSISNSLRNDAQKALVSMTAKLDSTHDDITIRVSRIVEALNRQIDKQQDEIKQLVSAQATAHETIESTVSHGHEQLKDRVLISQEQLAKHKVELRAQVLRLIDQFGAESEALFNETATIAGDAFTSTRKEISEGNTAVADHIDSVLRNNKELKPIVNKHNEVLAQVDEAREAVDLGCLSLNKVVDDSVEASRKVTTSQTHDIESNTDRLYGEIVATKHTISGLTSNGVAQVDENHNEATTSVAAIASHGNNIQQQQTDSIGDINAQNEQAVVQALENYVGLTSATVDGLKHANEAIAISVAHTNTRSEPAKKVPPPSDPREPLASLNVNV